MNLEKTHKRIYDIFSCTDKQIIFQHLYIDRDCFDKLFHNKNPYYVSDFTIITSHPTIRTGEYYGCFKIRQEAVIRADKYIKHIEYLLTNLIGQYKNENLTSLDFCNLLNRYFVQYFFVFEICSDHSEKIILKSETILENYKIIFHCSDKIKNILCDENLLPIFLKEFLDSLGYELIQRGRFLYDLFKNIEINFIRMDNNMSREERENAIDVYYKKEKKLLTVWAIIEELHFSGLSNKQILIIAQKNKDISNISFILDCYKLFFSRESMLKDIYDIICDYLSGKIILPDNIFKANHTRL